MQPLWMSEEPEEEDGNPLERQETIQKESKLGEETVRYVESEVFLNPTKVVERTVQTIVANMTKPLGITIEASTDEASMVYITSAGEKAVAAGLEVGDVISGVSGVYGPDIWSTKGSSVEKIRSLVRCRGDGYILIRVERGHVSLEERCNSEDVNCTIMNLYEESELDFLDMWREVYKEEAAMSEGSTQTSVLGQDTSSTEQLGTGLPYAASGDLET
ncbi:unnamed protein product [Discosporangium mesarthrocarpum]